MPQLRQREHLASGNSSFMNLKEPVRKDNFFQPVLHTQYKQKLE